MQWFKMDLHLHTPGSNDYQEPSTTYLDILRRAEMRGLDIIAFTDHNTVQGYKAMREEIKGLEFLDKLGRAEPDEKRRLSEYKHLLDKVLVLPGFEFTATFGFHILGIFAPDTPVRQLEHILFNLNIPPEALNEGSSVVGASSDVLTAYRTINEAGGLVIAAHANSTHGVAMKGFSFGGQTKIAYTQDPNLHALEVTDLERRGRHTTARFFDGSKPEYPRRMRCIQGSDAHRLIADPKKKKILGIGDRATEVLLPACTFNALMDMFSSNDFARTRPYRGQHAEFDFIQAAREEGESIVLAFHESTTRRAGRLYNIVADVCAFANTNGGTIYVGLDADSKKPPAGIANMDEAISTLRDEIESKLSPQMVVEIDAQETRKKTIVRIRIPKGTDPPYVLDDYKIYVRDEAETNLAVRDEVVQLVLSNRRAEPAQAKQPMPKAPSAAPEPPPPDDPSIITPPRTGVEVIGTEHRQGRQYHIMRDLRNGNIVKNVTRASAKRLWKYAIQERERNPVDPDKVQWFGDIGVWKKDERAGSVRYDLVQRNGSGLRVYYGVTDDGIHGAWQALVGENDEESD